MPRNSHKTPPAPALARATTSAQHQWVDLQPQHSKLVKPAPKVRMNPFKCSSTPIVSVAAFDRPDTAAQKDAASLLQSRHCAAPGKLRKYSITVGSGSKGDDSLNTE